MIKFSHVPRRWVYAILLVGLLTGIVCGIGGFTFIYARGLSYMTNDPAACVNCHIMTEQYEGWQHSSHRSVAVCNDCHAPHDLVGKYMTKAINGYHHSLAFTTGNFNEPIRITPRNRAITQAACRSCHADVVQEIDPQLKFAKGAHAGMGEPLDCLRCHASVGHMH